METQRHCSLRPALELALRRSEQLVSASQCTVYFLNARTLLEFESSTSSDADGGILRMVLRADAMLMLMRRLRYLACVLPRGQRVLLHLCRLPEDGLPGRQFDRGSVIASVNGINHLRWKRWRRHRRGSTCSSSSPPPRPLDADSLIRRAESGVRKREGGAGANSNADEDGALEAQVASEFGASPPAAVSLLCALLPELLHDLLSCVHGDSDTSADGAPCTSTAVDGEGEPKGDDGEGDASDEAVSYTHLTLPTKA